MRNGIARYYPMADRLTVEQFAARMRKRSRRVHQYYDGLLSARTNYGGWRESSEFSRMAGARLMWRALVDWFSRAVRFGWAS